MKSIYVLCLLLVVAFVSIKDAKSMEPLENLSLDEIILRSKHIGRGERIHNDEAMQGELDSHKSSLKDYNEVLLPEFWSIHNAVEEWGTILDRCVAMFNSSTSSKLLALQAKDLLERSQALLNTKNRDYYIFSGISSDCPTNLNDIPGDFEVDKPISSYYFKCTARPCIHQIEGRPLKVEILCTDPVFENVLRALMIASLGRIEESDNRSKAIRLVEEAKREFEILQWKSNNLIKTLSGTIEVLQKKIAVEERTLKQHYIEEIRKKAERDERQRATPFPPSSYRSTPFGKGTRWR